MSGPSLVIVTPRAAEAAAARRGAPGAAVLHSGTGPDSAAAAARRMAATAGAAVAVLGVGGSLDDRLRPGEVVVADRVVGPDAQWDLPAAPMVAARLRRAGLVVHVGALASAERAVTPGQRRLVGLATGALAADTESAWLLRGAAGRPAVVLRTVDGEPTGRGASGDGSNRSGALVGGGPGLTALASVREAAAVLSSWSEAVRPRQVVLAGPRSFCAGVERAVEIVERALERFGTPVYVRRQIVHNAHVVAELERAGAVFVQELDEVPAGATVVLSAHGVTPAVRADAAGRGMHVIDATCPLVAKVHAEARRFSRQGRHVLLIGHGGHDEVQGTLGEVPGTTLLQSPDDVATVGLDPGTAVGLLTQTTLAADEVAPIADAVRRRFRDTAEPASSDICFATQNRQDAVRAVAGECDVVLVVGSANSSNSNRLVEVAERSGARAFLVEDASGVDLDWVRDAATVGVSAGASTPEAVVSGVVDTLRGLGPIEVSTRQIVEENVFFQLPPEVR